MGSYLSITINSRIFLIVAILFIQSCSQKSNDFNILCQKFQELEIKENYQDLSSAEKYFWLSENLKEDIGETSNAYFAWNAISSASPNQRYMLLKLSAEESGLKNWQCKAAKNIIAEVG